MRRVLLVAMTFSFLLIGCSSQVVRTVKPMTERSNLSFVEWRIPSYFVPQELHVIGLGDSLTQGVGDEKKLGGYFGRVVTEMQALKGVKAVDADNLAKRGRRSDQLLVQLTDKKIQAELKNADVIFLTIGGNDIMRIVKANLFKLKVGPFYKELTKYESRIDDVFGTIRSLNSDAIIVIAGLYNPLSMVTDEPNEFEDIIKDWNEAISFRVLLDDKSCFVPVEDLFDSNENMVYHSDFFHPNSKGYDQMADRFLTKIRECGIPKVLNEDSEM